MPLDVEPPDPPDLTNRSPPNGIDDPDALDSLDDLRRGELEEFLRDGAWSEGFAEWAEYTDVTPDEYAVFREHELFDRMDFYWDPHDERVRFELGSVPESTHRDALASKTTVELSDLGDTVVETLEDGYHDWGPDERSDDVWSDETFTDESPLEE